MCRLFRARRLLRGARLVRVRVGPVKLGNLAPGELRELTPEEIRSLARATDM